MRSQRPTRSDKLPSGRPSRARSTLALLLCVATALAAAPAAAGKSGAPAPGKRAAGEGDRVARGQAKHHATRGAAARFRAPSTATTREATVTALGAEEVLRAAVVAMAKAKAAEKAKEKEKAQDKQSEKRKRAVAASPVVASPQPVATPVASPVTPTAAPAPSATATPVAGAEPRRGAPRATSPGRRMRPASRERGASAGRRAPATQAAPTPTNRRAADTIAISALEPIEGGARREERAEASPLTRTVVRVLEVVPLQARIALAALAALGLLLGAAAAVQTVRRRRLDRQRTRLLADVGVLQSALLPQLPERIGGARVTAAYRPAEGLAAGGDFYDAFELPGGRTGVLVGDVAGHGRDVVPLTALVRYNVRAYLEAGLSPRATVHVAANVLAAHLGERQVTLVVAIFDPGTGRLTYACAGHPPPLLLGTPAGASVTVCSSPPLGAGAPTGRRQTTVAFAPGAVACFHTDGLDEAPARFGRLGREAVAEELQALGPQRDAGQLIARVVRRTERQPDDMAVCILTALPGAAERWSLRIEELEVDAAALAGGWAERFLVACGVDRARMARALRETYAIIERDGAAIVEVRMGETLAEVRVTPPPAVALPGAVRRSAPARLAATG